jgi:carbamate kinase
VRIVVALGGSALLDRGEPLGEAGQRRRITEAAGALAALGREHEMVVTHGGPQVGLPAPHSKEYPGLHPFPLDILGAEAEGMIGYLLEQAIQNEMPDREVVTILTEVVVDAEDPAFSRPGTPVGPIYEEAAARALAAERGWRVGPDGDGYRRLVASPEPREIVQADTIRHLVESGVTVICGGGGGIPTTLDRTSGRRVGVEAAIDKDLFAALLAVEVDGDLLMLLTDVEFVHEAWASPEARAIRSAGPATLRGMTFAAGSMAPKVEAACRFTSLTGRPAAIGALEKAREILLGTSGTQIAEPTGNGRTAGA